MAVNAHAFVGMYSHALDTTAHLLAKGAEYASVNGVGEAELLGWRLIENMQPLSFKLMVV